MTSRIQSNVIVLLAAGIAGAVLYTAASYGLFREPTSLSEAELCGFLPGELTDQGHLAIDKVSAWWLAYVRKQDYFSAISMAFATSFVVLAMRASRRVGKTRVAGAAAGGGLLALSALCASCLAPVLSVIGIGVAGSWLVALPKWLIALNTLLLTSWGALRLTRQAGTCPLPTPGHASRRSDASPRTASLQG